MPFPYPTEFTTGTGWPPSCDPVRLVEGKQPTPPQRFTPSDHLAALKRILHRATLNGGRLHPQEVLAAKQCVEAMERTEEERHAESLRNGGCAND